MVLRLRDVTEEERAKLERIVRAALEGLSAPQIAARVGVGEATARQWVKRYNAAGLAGVGRRAALGAPTDLRGGRAEPGDRQGAQRTAETGRRRRAADLPLDARPAGGGAE